MKRRSSRAPGMNLREWTQDHGVPYRAYFVEWLMGLPPGWISRAPNS